MNIAYQKDEPLFSQWRKKGDPKSMKKFQNKFITLAPFHTQLFC